MFLLTIVGSAVWLMYYGLEDWAQALRFIFFTNIGWLLIKGWWLGRSVQSVPNEQNSARDVFIVTTWAPGILEVCSVAWRPGIEEMRSCAWYPGILTVFVVERFSPGTREVYFTKFIT